MSNNAWNTGSPLKGKAVASRGGKAAWKKNGQPARLVEADISTDTRRLNLSTSDNPQQNQNASPNSILTSGDSDEPTWQDIRAKKNISSKVGSIGKEVTIITNRINFRQIPKYISVFHFAFTDAEGKDSSQKVDITQKINIVKYPLAYDGSKIVVQYGPIQEGKTNPHEDNYVLDQLSDMLNSNSSRLKLDSREDITLDSTGENVNAAQLQYLNIILAKNLPAAQYESMPTRPSGGGRGRGRGRGGRGRGGFAGGGRPDHDAETLDIRYNYKSAMIHGENGPQFALDVQGTVVYKEMSLIDFLQKRGLFKNGRLDISKAQRELEGIKLLPVHRKEARPFIAKGLTRETVGVLTFQHKDGRKSSVLSYFRETYPNVKLDTRFPCVKASQKKSIYYPFEVLYIAKEQTFKGEIPRSAISNVHLDPQQRQPLIVKGAKDIQALTDKSSGGQFKLEKELLKVKAREIGPTNVRKGQKFHIPKTINKWVVVVADNRAQANDVQTVIKSFIAAGTSSGMRIAQPVGRPISIRFGRELEPALRAYVNQGLEFILLIKAEHDKNLYNEAKYYSWISAGVPLQVCLSKHFRNAQENRLRFYMGNLLLKVNIKMGGSNFKFAQGVKGLPSQNTLILGMDASHGMLNLTGLEKLPNMASIALIAFDPKTNKFKSSCISQSGRDDIVKTETMTKLLAGLNINFKKYDSIIMYRDGVGESMFNRVEQHEYVALRNFVGAKVKISFLVFNKRHRTRFFKHENGKFVNPNAGTVVDTVVTNKDDYDFYLQAHRCGIGSASLPHYIVLHDDHKFNADNLQGVTNQLSSLYQRSFGPVSQTCTAYYAHILADKCRLLMNERGQLPSLNQRILSVSQMYFL